MSKTAEFTSLKELLTIAGLPELGPGPRAGVLPTGKIADSLDKLLVGSRLSVESQRLVRGLVLLWHDHMDEAHAIAQDIETTDGSFLHGILHRREPDYGNATYWFRRVGRHACFPEIARRTGELLNSKHESELSKQLIHGGEWDPYGFIGLCEKAAGKAVEATEVKLLREIQGIEMEVLLENWSGSH